MDAIQSKLNVIHWLTDYQCKFEKKGSLMLVSLQHKKGFLAYMYSDKSVFKLTKKLDSFLDRKLKVTHKIC